jgi:hypothetical protein
MAVKILGTTVIDNSRNFNVGIATFTRLDVAPIPITFSPGVGVTFVALASNIIITFNQQITKGTGNITLRENSAGGTAFSTIGVTSTSVTISGGAVTIDPPANIGSATTTFVVVDAGAFIGLTTTSVNALIDNYSFTTATITNTLFSWGRGSYGRLGQNTTTDVSSPVQIPGTTWSSISAAEKHSLATKTDGTLWSWGQNDQGRLGQSDTTNRSSPVQIPGTSWNAIRGGRQHSLATKTDGTLWSWGNGELGQLGQNTTTNISSPIQIPGTTWSFISGNQTSLATKTDGTLWAWGHNTSGQLGHNDTILRSSPVQIPGTSWSSISAGYSHSLAKKTDNTLWAWGNNNNGKLGQNNRTQFSSPVQSQEPHGVLSVLVLIIH